MDDYYMESKNSVEIIKYIIHSGNVGIRIDTDCWRKLNSLIAKQFKLEKDGKLMYDITGDDGFQDYIKGDSKIYIGWDMMSPFEIISQNKEGDTLLDEIFEWLLMQDIPIDCKDLGSKFNS